MSKHEVSDREITKAIREDITNEELRAAMVIVWRHLRRTEPQDASNETWWAITDPTTDSGVGLVLMASRQ